MLPQHKEPSSRHALKGQKHLAQGNTCLLYTSYILLLVFGFWVPRLITRNHDDQGTPKPNTSKRM